MFTADTIIDSVQDAKKKFVTTFVTDESFKTELVKLVDAETQFAKNQTKTSLEIAQNFWKNTTNIFYPSKDSK